MTPIMTWIVRTVRALLVCGLAISFGQDAAAQRGVGDETSRMLRQAAALEANGDLEGAERALREILARNPATPAALFALDRVVRARGAPLSVLPAVDAFLEREPGAAEVRSLELRVLAEADSLSALEREANAWLAAAPGDLEAYREVARIYEDARGPEAALEILLRGRTETGREALLALEIGDLLSRLERMDDALEEWTRAVGDDGAGAAAVTRRLSEIERGQAVRVLNELSSSSVFARRRAGALMALELGFVEEASEQAREVADELGGRARMAFLEQVGARARERNLPELASWAYDELGDDARTPAERRAFDQRRVEAALIAGDSAAAAAAQWRIARSYGPGEPDRRRATARAIELESSTAEPDALREMIADFERDFPDAPELDPLSALAAARLRSAGDLSGALSVVEQASGPESAMERAYLLLASGDVALAREALLDAAGGMPPAEATGAIQLAGLLGRLSPGAAGLIGRMAVEARADGAEAAAALEAGLEGVPPEERAAVLAEGARIADRVGATEAAVRLRTRLLEAHADDPDAADALVSLARHHAARPGGREHAISILEELIASRPNGAVVPTARAELERLRGTP